MDQVMEAQLPRCSVTASMTTSHITSKRVYVTKNFLSITLGEFMYGTRFVMNMKLFVNLDDPAINVCNMPVTSWIKLTQSAPFFLYTDGVGRRPYTARLD